MKVGIQNPLRARRAVLLASKVGLARASDHLGISMSQISEWRMRIERETGEVFPRLKRGRKPGFGKLNLEKARVMRARRRRGVSTGVIARLAKVHPSTARRVCSGERYPEPAA